MATEIFANRHLIWYIGNIFHDLILCIQSQNMFIVENKKK